MHVVTLHLICFILSIILLRFSGRRQEPLWGGMVLKNIVKASLAIVASLLSAPCVAQSDQAIGSNPPRQNLDMDGPVLVAGQDPIVRYNLDIIWIDMLNLIDCVENCKVKFKNYVNKYNKNREKFDPISYFNEASKDCNNEKNRKFCQLIGNKYYFGGFQNYDIRQGDDLPYDILGFQMTTHKQQIIDTLTGLGYRDVTELLDPEPNDPCDGRYARHNFFHDDNKILVNVNYIEACHPFSIDPLHDNKVVQVNFVFAE